MVVVRDTKWILTAAIAAWLLALALEVVFWTLLIVLRCRRPQRKANFLDHNDDLTERSDKNPSSFDSSTKPDISPRMTTQGSLVVLQAFDSVRNWSRPLPNAPIRSLPRPRPVPKPLPKPLSKPLPKPMKSALSPTSITSNNSNSNNRNSHTPQKLPRLPLPYRLHTYSPESPPFPSASAQPAQPATFLNLLNRPRIKAVPPPPLALSLPLALREQEASNLAAFDDWDTSSVSMQDRIVYSIAAAEATAAKPGEPPHARRMSQSSSTSHSGSDRNSTRMHRSASMPTPPRTPPAHRSRTGSVGSSNTTQRSLRIVSPMPTSPASPNNLNLSQPIPSTAGRLRTMGIKIPFCDSPDREHAVLISGHPSSTPTTLPDVESPGRGGSSLGEPVLVVPSPAGKADAYDDDEAAWQRQWAATLERKVTPPMPGFEVGPLESMRRMREERERQQQQQQDQGQGQVQTQDLDQDPEQLLLGDTSWIAEESGSEGDAASIILEYANNRFSYSAPGTPTASEAPSRSRISEIIDEIQEGLVAGMV
ncbi:hypothetical protein DRE_03006 [Drechslerella stenobrocha 248]|uniref:Uncharacterized protein n=1 Tax=Drechslerella stenobrocha 248 TaxID=1043628 RepID=W7HUC3_9PEZI|nr:hypothetical protein DRE_03006 [Drechslerella stenobrocha 248]